MGAMADFVALDEKAVLAALNALRHAQPLPAGHPLASFFSVQGDAAASGLTGRALAELCIFQALSVTTRRQLRRLRAAGGLDWKTRRGRTIVDLQRDFQA